MAMQNPVVLKKYANRRLYDTERSLYVTLPEVAELIRQGRRVEVYDAQTREDVTAFILTQVVLDEAKNKNTLLPVPLLHLIIQFGDNMLGEFFETYLQQIIQAYLAQKAVFKEQFKQWIDSGMSLSDLANRTWTEMNGIKTLFDLNPFFNSNPGQPQGRTENEKDEK
jgi:polyhydroxyalkanoate synthesis repressor PhaR